MSRAWRHPIVERAGLVCLVAGAHLATFSLLSKSTAQRSVTRSDFILVELEPIPLAPAQSLPVIDRSVELPERVLPDLGAPAPLPAPNTFPSPVRRAPALELAEIAPPIEDASPNVPSGPGEAALEIQPPLSLAAQTALRGLVCNRLSSDPAARCAEEGEGVDIWAAAARAGPQAIASAMESSGEVMPIHVSGDSGFFDTLAARQGDLDRDNPYRIGATLETAGKTGQHVIPASAPGSQASRDMGLRAMAAPHPVWGD